MWLKNSISFLSLSLCSTLTIPLCSTLVATLVAPSSPPSRPSSRPPHRDCCSLLAATITPPRCTLDALKMSLLVGNLPVAAMFTMAHMPRISLARRGWHRQQFQVHRFGDALSDVILKSTLWLINHDGEVRRRGAKVQWHGGGSGNVRWTWQCRAWVGGTKAKMEEGKRM